MTQSSPFRIDALERDGLHAVALTFDDPMKAIERLQQSDGMSAYWGFLIDMDHESIFFDAGSVEIEELRAAVSAALAEGQ